MQAPLVQAGVPLATVQVRAQVPQCCTVSRLDSQPLVGLLSQSPKPALQVPVPQPPAVHFGVPFAVEQALPQLPQLFTSVPSFTQAPLHSD